MKFYLMWLLVCLLYTSDAADDLLCVDLGGRRIIKKKNNTSTTNQIILQLNPTTKKSKTQVNYINITS